VLSPQQKVDCDHTCYSGTSTCNAGCNGGYLDLAWQNFVSSGVVPDVCIPYQCGDGSCTEPSCPTTCTSSSYNYTQFQATSSYSLSSTVTDIQRDIQQYGPVQAAMNVYQDLLNFAGGAIYIYDQSSSLVGGHAVKILGWGTENSVDYWLVENSWGNAWADSGYFRIRRGSNECGIESYIVTGLPKINGVNYNNNYSQNTAPVTRPVVVSVLGLVSVMMVLLF